MTDVLPEDGEVGPAMQALTEKQQKFVRAVIALARDGEENYAKAAREAGYSDHMERCKVTGHFLSHDARVQAALLEESKKRVSLAASVIATPVAVKIAMDEKVSPKDRLRACEMLFNRGGMPAQTEHKVTVEHRQPRQMVELAERLAAELGVDKQKLIGLNRDAAKVVDAEFTEVSQ
jgi:phage terminase small subunit